MGQNTSPEDLIAQSAPQRAWYSGSVDEFLLCERQAILGQLLDRATFAVELPQRHAWQTEIEVLKSALHSYRGRGRIYLEYAIPRLGGRIDAVVLIDHVLFVVEFKVGETEFQASALDQVFDYALDLKNFHDATHEVFVAPILVATGATASKSDVRETPQRDRLLYPICAVPQSLESIFREVTASTNASQIDAGCWERGRYCPTPTIIEAAQALYAGHRVEEISRSDAAAINLTRTSEALCEIIRVSEAQSQKSICFVTGVPGAGKTLIGLNIATQHFDQESKLYSVFLSGNGPLVEVLREALAQDRQRRELVQGRRLRLKAARSEVKTFIQNVHHFRDDCLKDDRRPPIEHVAIFDEAQRAWNAHQTSKFMRQKRQRADFRESEPEFLISCLDRHADWATIVCLVGGGQEINTGEAGIGEWFATLLRRFTDWNVYLSPRLHDSEFGSGEILESLRAHPGVHFRDDLHLSVSMRSFRAESVSQFVKHLLDQDEVGARRLLREFGAKYPIRLTRDVTRAKAWLRAQARGSERYGLVVSSQAYRLKPHAIDVRAPVEPVHWFLGDKCDVRSSYYLEDVATEFHVQGLELDWTGVVWDADLRFRPQGWTHHSFVGTRWKNIRAADDQQFLKNAYRVLLTRARQGMVVVVPEGDTKDVTRTPELYDPTFKYLRCVGLELI